MHDLWVLWILNMSKQFVVSCLFFIFFKTLNAFPITFVNSSYEGRFYFFTKITEEFSNYSIRDFYNELLFFNDSNQLCNNEFNRFGYIRPDSKKLINFDLAGYYAFSYFSYPKYFSYKDVSSPIIYRMEHLFTVYILYIDSHGYKQIAELSV